MADPITRLLLVDDDDVCRELFRRMFSRLDMKVECVEADSLVIARDILANGRFDCVLLDYHLGSDLGLELLADIAKHRAGMCPVILTTLLAFEEVGDEAARGGVVDYIAKSTADPVKLQATIERALQRAAASEGMGRQATAASGNGSAGQRGDALQEKYRRRRHTTLKALDRLDEGAPLPPEEITELARLLHQLAGTAAHFDDAPLGLLAAQLEKYLLHWRSDAMSDEMRDALSAFRLAASRQAPELLRVSVYQ
ncbi:MAG: response regulator [Sphingobium sp.]